MIAPHSPAPRRGLVTAAWITLILGVCWTVSSPAQESEPAPDSVEEPDAEVPPTAPLPESWFENVEVIPKESLGIREEETEAYFRILDRVRSVPAAALREAEEQFRRARIRAYAERVQERITQEAKRDPRAAEILRKRSAERIAGYEESPWSYPLVKDALNAPTTCRGQVLSFRGHVRRIVKTPAGENEFGITDLYETWLYDEEGEGRPVVVVSTEIPADVPINFPETEPLDGISAQGYYFKMYAFRGEEKIEYVPLILARTIAWNPPTVPAREFPIWGYAVIALAGVILLYLVIRRPRDAKRYQQLRERVGGIEDNPYPPGTG